MAHPVYRVEARTGSNDSSGRPHRKCLITSRFRRIFIGWIIENPQLMRIDFAFEKIFSNLLGKLLYQKWQKLFVRVREFGFSDFEIRQSAPSEADDRRQYCPITRYCPRRDFYLDGRPDDEKTESTEEVRQKLPLGASARFVSFGEANAEAGLAIGVASPLVQRQTRHHQEKRQGVDEEDADRCVHAEAAEHGDFLREEGREEGGEGRRGDERVFC